MPGWNGSTRSARLPGDWPRRRARALRRDHHRCCQILEDGTRCTWTDPTGKTLEVDHIARGDDHSLTNLQTLCGRGSTNDHHQVKTIAERRPPRRRPQEPHPGQVR